MKTHKVKRPMRIPTVHSSYIVPSNEAQVPGELQGPNEEDSTEEEFENPDILDVPVPVPEEEFLEEDFEAALRNVSGDADTEPLSVEPPKEDGFAEELPEINEVEVEPVHLTPEEASVPVFGRPVVRNASVAERSTRQEIQVKTAATTGIRWKKK